MAELTTRIVLGSVVLVVLCAMLAVRLQRTITGPLGRLAAAIQRVGTDGGLDQRLEHTGRDEIAVLYRRFNEMLDQLRERARERDRNQLWLQTLVRSLPDEVYVCDAEGRVIDVRHNAPSAAWSSVGRPIRELVSAENADAAMKAITETLRTGESVRIDTHIAEGDRRFETVFTPLESSEASEAPRVLAVSRDVTERDRLQAQFLRAQKLDAVGQLAGGVAHDFNNLLAGIVGYAELIKLGDNGPKAAQEILEISERAADLVKQLLRFSRKESSQKRATDVAEILSRVERILRHTLDPRIELVVVQPQAPCTVHGDPSQLESAVLNLAVNARDAMPSGGRLELRANRVSLDALALSALDCVLSPGTYVEIVVTDTGVGIPDEVLGRIFEPFFTTKEAGKGTGLGLAAVYGTVQAHKGGVHVRTEAGKGTMFHVFVPALDAAVAVATPTKLARGSGRLLLIDDEEAVLKTAEALLTQLGYEVRSFSRPRDAIAYFEEHHARVDAVVVDMMMPQLSGAEVIERLRQVAPRVPVMVASGYLGVAHELPAAIATVPILRKPFTLEELASAVRELMKVARQKVEQSNVH